MPFLDRRDAGRRLAEALAVYKSAHPVILALPRGGVPVAAEVARALEASLDLLIVRKIGVPAQPELAMGAVTDGYVVRKDEIIQAACVPEAAFARLCEREMAEIRRRRELYLAGRPHPDVKNRVVIVVDDGIATGATTLAALRSIRNRAPARLILAIPVAPTEALEDLRREADEIVCLEDYESFGAVGSYYADFAQVSDEDVIRILASLPSRTAIHSAK